VTPTPAIGGQPGSVTTWSALTSNGQVSSTHSTHHEKHYSHNENNLLQRVTGFSLKELSMYGIIYGSTL